MDSGRYVFGENIPEVVETPKETQKRLYHETTKEIEKRRDAEMAQLKKQQQLDRDSLDAKFNQEHHENAVRSGYRKEPK